MSDAAPPDTTQAARLMAPTSIILVIGISFYVTRIWVRSHRIFQLDFTDGMTSAALALATVNLALTAVGCHYGIGRHTSHVDGDVVLKARFYGFLIQPICVWSICLARCSITCTVLRTRQTRVWWYVFGSIIAVQLASALVTTITQLVQCHPISALWDDSTAMLSSTRCWSPYRIQICGYVIQGSSILTDMVLSLTPVVFLRATNRTRHERIALGVLVGLGLLVTLSTAINTVLIHTYRDMQDTLWDMVTPVLWWQIEQNCSIIASCVICLNSPYKTALVRLGLLQSNSRSSSTSGQLNILNGWSHDLDLYRTTIRADKAMSINSGSEPPSRERIMYASRFSPFKPAAPLPMITKTMEVVHSSEEAREDVEWGSPARRFSWR